MRIFLPNPTEKRIRAVEHILAGGVTLLQLGLDIAVADDGSGNQLGEQGDVQQEFEIGPLDAHLLPVDIHHIAHGLEGVEADADGQGNLRHRQRKAGDLIEGGDEESGVFEHAQGQQIDDDRQYQHPAIGLPCSRLAPIQRPAP